MDKRFSWQKKDLEWLQMSDLPRICMVKYNDIESQFNIMVFSFNRITVIEQLYFSVDLDYDKSGAARPYRPIIIAIEVGLALSRKLTSHS